MRIAANGAMKSMFQDIRRMLFGDSGVTSVGTVGVEDDEDGTQ